jgi:hypothetical protein
MGKTGNVYVADHPNHRVQKWAPGATSGVTVAGGNGPGSAADQLDKPWGVTLDGAGTVFVADYNNHRVQKWVQGTPPTVTTPSDQTVATNTGTCAATVTLTPFTVTGVPAPSVTISTNRPDGPTLTQNSTAALFPLGTTEVTATVTNPAATITATYTVTVNDTQTPTIGGPLPHQNALATGPAGATVIYPTPTVTDNCPDVSVTATPPSGSLFPVGDTTVTVTATDSAGNTATATFSVHVAGALEQLAALRPASVGVGSGNKLVNRVDKVADALQAACGALSDYVNDVNAQTGKKIPEATATTLVASAARIAAVVGCTT